VLIFIHPVPVEAHCHTKCSKKKRSRWRPLYFFRFFRTHAGWVQFEVDILIHADMRLRRAKKRCLLVFANIQVFAMAFFLCKFLVLDICGLWKSIRDVRVNSFSSVHLKLARSPLVAGKTPHTFEMQLMFFRAGFVGNGPQLWDVVL
jgi:hypothetical protein